VAIMSRGTYCRCVTVGTEGDNKYTCPFIICKMLSHYEKQMMQISETVPDKICVYENVSTLK
jgi:hypothetical protein